MPAKILLVHDQPELLKQAQDALEPHHAVTTCSGIEEAITQLKELEEAHLNKVPLDLVLCNVHIESSRNTLTVFDLLKWIRGNPQIKDVPFLLVCFKPSEVAHHFMDSIHLAGASLGASGYVAMEQLEPAKFVRLIETYLPAEYRTQKEAISEEIADFSPIETHREQSESRNRSS
jgi:CheY-like chemotaxis protein